MKVIANKLNEELINSIYMTLATKDDTEALKSVLKLCAEAYDVSGVGILTPGKKPFVIELTYYYSGEQETFPGKIQLSINELNGWDNGGSFATDQGVISCDDVCDESAENKTAQIVTGLNSRAFLAANIIQEYDFMGVLVLCTGNEPRHWNSEEKEFANRIAGILYCPLLKINRRNTEQQIFEDCKREAEESREIKDRFLSNISHEIRTPLNAIAGMTTILRYSSGDPSVLDQCIERIDKASRQMLDLFNRCIDITLFDKDNSVLSNSWFYFEELVRDLKNNFKGIVDQKQQIFNVEFPEHTLVCGDREKLTHILENILKNAFTFTKKGGEISLNIECKAVHGKKFIYKFIIRDNGVGMEESFLKTLFEPFTKEIIRVNETDSGNGLGMTIAKHLVEMLHGEITVSSVKQEGTSVVIDIPLERDDTDMKHESGILNDDRESYEFTETYIGRRMLVAEDNSLMAEILIELLGYRGIEADLAGNGQEAVDLYMSHEDFYYDMILMDIQMPVMDGYEATRIIRQSDKADALLVPIAALSAEIFDDAIDRAYECGMNVHLAKPIGENELMKAISRFVL